MSNSECKEELCLQKPLQGSLNADNRHILFSLPFPEADGKLWFLLSVYEAVILYTGSTLNQHSIEDFYHYFFNALLCQGPENISPVGCWTPQEH